MTKEILKLNSNGELVFKDPDTGNITPVTIADLTVSNILSASDVDVSGSVSSDTITLAERTSDPLSPSTGELWYRSDKD